MIPARRAIPLLLAILAFRALCQERRGHISTANVTVAAVDEFGSLLSEVKVDSFVDEQGHDRVALFHGSPTANGIPLGQYRITVHADVGFRSSTFDVDVYEPDLLITAGLEWYGVENSRITGRLRGKLSGFPQAWTDWWCKASGLYTRVQFESAVEPSDSSFDFGDVPPGIYTLACVANRKFIALRAARIAADATPITIDYKPNEDGEAVKH